MVKSDQTTVKVEYDLDLQPLIDGFEVVQSMLADWAAKVEVGIEALRKMREAQQSAPKDGHEHPSSAPKAPVTEEDLRAAFEAEGGADLVGPSRPPSRDVNTMGAI